MEGKVRLKLDMAERVRDFCLAHPGTATQYTDTMARLEEQLSRAQSLATQFVSGRIERHASSGTRQQLQRALVQTPLKDLVRIARVALGSDAELARRFVLPSGKASKASFLAQARALAAEATDQKALFVSYGMAEGFLDDLTAGIEAYAKADHEAHDGRASHVSARAELRKVARELVALVKQLDAMNRVRFKGDTGLLTAWVSASNVEWPHPDSTPTPKKDEKAA